MFFFEFEITKKLISLKACGGLSRYFDWIVLHDKAHMKYTAVFRIFGIFEDK